MKSVFCCIALACLFASCSTPPKEKIPTESPMEKPAGKIIIYQMMTRLFGNKVTTNKPYGTIEENGVGKFADVNDAALKSLKEMGITHVWYTGVMEHAVLTDYTADGIPLDDADVVKGRAGSPYAIKDCYDVNPDLAIKVRERSQEFDQLISRTHAQGLKVIIDFVANHVARAYRSDAKPKGVQDFGAADDTTKAFSPGNNFYYLPGQAFQPPKGHKPLGPNTFPTLDGRFDESPAKVTGNDQFSATPGANEWFETVKLNYGVDIQNGRATHFDPVPDTWNKMRDILVYWANKKVDGFRCDMAEMIPVEFWHWVIPQVKAVNPELIFVAEIYNAAQYRSYIETGKFDFLYDKVQLYDSLRLMVQGQRSTQDVHAIHETQVGIHRNMLHFLENHDEQRIASKAFAGDPWKAAPAMVISATLDEGPVMIYFGQEVGEPGAGAEGFQTDDGRTTIYDYWGVPEHQKWMNGGKFDGGLLSPEQKQLRLFYSELLNLVGKNAAINGSAYYDLTQHNINAGNINDKVNVFLRYAGEERLLIVTSFNTADQPARINIPADALKRMQLDPAGTYIARDLLWHDAEIGFDNTQTCELKLKPFSSFIFKIK